MRKFNKKLGCASLVILFVSLGLFGAGVALQSSTVGNVSMIGMIMAIIVGPFLISVAFITFACACRRKIEINNIYENLSIRKPNILYQSSDGSSYSSDTSYGSGSDYSSGPSYSSGYNTNSNNYYAATAENIRRYNNTVSLGYDQYSGARV